MSIIDELIQRLNPDPIFDDKKFRDIMEMRKKLAKIEWHQLDQCNFINQDDANIYIG